MFYKSRIFKNCLESFKNVQESFKNVLESFKNALESFERQKTPPITSMAQRNKTNLCAVKSKQKRPPAEIAADLALGFASLSAEGLENRRCICRAWSQPGCEWLRGRESRSRDASPAEKSASASASGSLARPMVNEECLEGANQVLGEKSSERLSEGDGVSET